jgi:hypothetical protein
MNGVRRELLGQDEDLWNGQEDIFEGDGRVHDLNCGGNFIDT